MAFREAASGTGVRVGSGGHLRGGLETAAQRPLEGRERGKFHGRVASGCPCRSLGLGHVTWLLGGLRGPGCRMQWIRPHFSAGLLIHSYPHTPPEAGNAAQTTPHRWMDRLNTGGSSRKGRFLSHPQPATIGEWAGTSAAGKPSALCDLGRSHRASQGSRMFSFSPFRSPSDLFCGLLK